MAIKREIEVTPTPAELAIAFANLDSDDQALFFTVVGLEVNEWGHPFVAQLQAVTDCPDLDAVGRQVMHYIGEYAYKHKETNDGE